MITKPVILISCLAAAAPVASPAMSAPQQRDQGYYYGAIDGIVGPRTRPAIGVYERTHDLPGNGVIEDQLLADLSLG